MTGKVRTCGGHVEGGLLGGAHLPLIARLLNAPFIAVIKAYQLTLSPIVGRQCRFYPTCSWYGLEAYRTHGPIKGTWLTVVRILKCQPCHRGGYDPVPPRR